MILYYCTLIGMQDCISTFEMLDEILTDDYVKTVKYLVYFNEEESELHVHMYCLR